MIRSFTVLQVEFTSIMEVHGVVVVSMAKVTSFRVFYERIDLPVFVSVGDSQRAERVSLENKIC